MKLTTELRRQRLVAIVRGGDAPSCLRTVVALAEEGIGLIEVSLTSERAWSVIEQGIRELGQQARLGVGTVLSADEAKRALDVGAEFAVTPNVGSGAVEAHVLGLPVLVGALTPTEIAAAVELGADAVKLFPAGAGGPDYLRAVRAPFPHVDFVPVGGVHLDDVAAYRTSGAIAVGIGSPLVGDAADGGDLPALRARARRLISSLNDWSAS